jgi:uncharacterized protein (TIGR02266 family)
VNGAPSYVRPLLACSLQTATTMTLLQDAHPNTPTEPCMSNAELPAVERRTVRRIELHVGVGFRSGLSFYTGYTLDISEGGLFVASHMLKPIGSELALTFALPTGPEISVRAIVRWQRDPQAAGPSTPPGMGVEFQGLTPEDHARIRELVTQRSAPFYTS